MKHFFKVSNQLVLIISQNLPRIISQFDIKKGKQAEIFLLKLQGGKNVTNIRQNMSPDNDAFALYTKKIPQQSSSDNIIKVQEEHSNQKDVSR